MTCPIADMTDCTKKCKCPSGVGVCTGRAYDCAKPCGDSLGLLWQPDTCDCLDVTPCGGTVQESGGAGTTVTTVNLGYGGGTVSFYYEAYRVKDSFTVTGAVSFSTGGPVSGSQTVFLAKDPDVNIATVTVTGPTGTAWQWSMSCPS